jgi:hypothetical protein
MDSFEKWFGKADGSTPNDLAIEYWCRAAYAAGLRRAAEIANEPYSNAVQASGSDEPSEVGLKIAEAIEREAEKLEGE